MQSQHMQVQLCFINRSPRAANGFCSTAGLKAGAATQTVVREVSLDLKGQSSYS